MRFHLFTLTLLLLASYSVMAQTFTDPRDGTVYRTITIGETTWFSENLNYKMDDSFCYNDDESNCKKFGRMYKWEAALNACPPGWHLSTEYEWQYIEENLGMAFEELAYRGNRGTNEGGKMKKGGQSGLDILFAGWRRKNGTYKARGENAALWTATESDFAHAWHRDIDIGDDFSFRSRVVKSYALSCRCVKNHYAEDSPEN